MISEYVQEIRALAKAFEDKELRKTFIFCVISQLREENVTKEKELQIMRLIHDDYIC